MERTLMAVFDNRGDAQSALDALIAAGFSHQQASLSDADPTGAPDAVMADNDGSIVGSIKHFLSTMFGTDNSEYVQKYADAVTRGHQVLTLHVTHERELGRATGIIARWNPVDIDDTRVQWATGTPGTPGSGAVRSSARARQQAAPMSQQSVQGAPGSMQGPVEGAAGSRQAPSAPGAQQRDQGTAVGRGGPAAQRSGVPVSGQVSGQVSGHLAEPPLGVDVPAAADESYFRSHYERHYAGQGEQYDAYAPAYQFGAFMASADQYRGRAWHEVAPQLKGDWARRHPGADWTRFEAAVRHGWEKMPS